MARKRSPDVILLSLSILALSVLVDATRDIRRSLHLSRAPFTFFVVYAPDFDEFCGGCVVLHYLVHQLNVVYGSAQPVAYIVPYSFPVNRTAASIKVKKGNATPPLPTWLDSSQGIAIYPEGVTGNPLGSKHVVQWILYFPEERLMSLFQPSSLIACYSDRICAGFNKSFSRVPMRVVDYGLDNFKNLRRSKERAGTILYGWKEAWESQQVEASSTSLPSENSTAFFTFQYATNETLPKTTPKRERLEKFASAQLFYSTDPATFMNVEAAMAGCLSVVEPVPGVSKDEWMETAYGKDELRYGIAYGFDDVPHAERTLRFVLPQMERLARMQYKRVIRFVDQVNSFFSVEEKIPSPLGMESRHGKSSAVTRHRTL
jgi:hypothetical protein